MDRLVRPCSRSSDFSTAHKTFLVREKEKTTVFSPIPDEKGGAVGGLNKKGGVRPAVAILPYLFLGDATTAR